MSPSRTTSTSEVDDGRCNSVPYARTPNASTRSRSTVPESSRILDRIFTNQDKNRKATPPIDLSPMIRLAPTSLSLSPTKRRQPRRASGYSTASSAQSSQTPSTSSGVTALVGSIIRSVSTHQSSRDNADSDDEDGPNVDSIEVLPNAPIIVTIDRYALRGWTSGH